MKNIKCPFCSQKFIVIEGKKDATKRALYNHIELEHSEKVTKEFPAARLVFNYVNNKQEGTCTQCRVKPTTWNKDKEKYHRFCSDKCKVDYTRMAKDRMVKVYGKEHLLNDPDKQKELLANRKISGEYTHTDGTKFTYTGSYELDLLEYLDTVLKVDSDDIYCPAPMTFNYLDENGEKRFYIPDFYIESLNLIIEVKSADNKHYRTRDLERELLKDDAVPKEFNFIKVLDKNYKELNNFFIKNQKKQKFIKK